MRKRSSKTTKRAMTTSIISILLCLAMFVGATFAWFTDTASTSVNKIESGTLDVQLLDKDDKSLEGKTLKFLQADSTGKQSQSDSILWEPGATYELPEVYVKNKGSLDLKYKIVITGIIKAKSSEDSTVDITKLNEAIDWTIKDGDSEYKADTDKTLKAGSTSNPLTIKGTMKTSAGNEYQGLSIDGISITVYATQATGEYDSTGNDYDSKADYNYRSATISVKDETEGRTYTLETGKSYTVDQATVTVDDNGHITYENKNGAGQTVTITTGGQNLTIDAEKDTVYHNGSSGKVIVTAVASSSFHELGQVDVLEIAKGRVVVENGNNVANLQVKPTETNVVPIVAVPQNVKLETNLEVTKEKTVKVAVIDNNGAEIAKDTFEIKQSGSTVDKSIPTELVEVLKKSDGDNTVKLNEAKAYSVMVDKKGYESFDEALRAVNDNQTIKLIDNAETSSLTVGKAITIDLNGKTLTATNQPNISDKGILTIQDSGENGQIVLNGSGGISLNEGKLILNSGKIYRKTGGNISLWGAAQFVMEDGSLVADTGELIDASYLPNNSKITINGGLIQTGEAIKAAVSIDAKVFYGTTTGYVEAYITGGTIKSNSGVSVGVYSENVTLNISGGTFDGDIVNEKGTVNFENKNYKLNGDYVVCTEDALASAASADYTNEDDPTLNTIESNIDSVVLGDNITLTSPITIRKTMTIDGNNHSLVTDEKISSDRAINLWDGKNMVVTLKNLTIKGPNTYACRAITTGDTKSMKLILDNCDISTLYYAINILNDTNLEIVAKDTTLKGYAAMQTQSPNMKATFEDCTLIGYNWSDDPVDEKSKGENNFETIVIYSDAKGTNLTFKNCDIKAVEQGTAKEYLLCFRTGDATVTFDNCNFFKNDKAVSLDELNDQIDNDKGGKVIIQ